MSDLRFLIVMACLLAALALTIFAIRFFERRRMAALRAAGSALGLTPFGHGERFTLPSVELVRKRTRRIGAALSGEWKGLPVLVFDLSHRTGKSISVQTVLVAQFAGVRLPEFAAIERNFNRYTPTVDLLRVESPPAELARHYHLYTRDGHWPFEAETDRFIASHRDRHGLFGVGWSFEGTGNAIAIYRRGVKARTPMLARWLDETTVMARGLAQVLSSQ